MNYYSFTTRGYSPALEYAAKDLEQAGWLRCEQAPIVLLPVPSLENDGSIKGGASLQLLPHDGLIVGGNLPPEAMDGRKYLDLLQHPLYLSENGAITAHCALGIALEKLPVTLENCPVLVVGWGRIGKCLVRLLRLLGARVTVAARSESDRALVEALGYTSMDIREEAPALSSYRLIFNTVPAMVLPAKKLRCCREDCLKIDLASVPGIDAEDVIWARGLPNRLAPESSGKLIARIIRKELEI